MACNRRGAIHGRGDHLGTVDGPRRTIYSATVGPAGPTFSATDGLGGLELEGDQLSCDGTTLI